jgi:uncharacterized membrane-anchored protein
MYKGTAKVDKKTKNLVKRLCPTDIAIIKHRDIDEVSANSLVDSKVKVIINADSSISGVYPNRGPKIIQKAGIILLDEVGDEFFEKVQEGDLIEVIGQDILINKEYAATGKLLSKETINYKMQRAKENIEVELDKFIENTLEYAKKEKSLVTGGIEIPEIKTTFKGRQALVVVRGLGYKKDLSTLRRYIKEIDPVLIGVDGGADALLEFGFKPDMVVGDMDSVSDETLKTVKEIVVHAYTDGRAPGLERVKGLGLESIIFSAPGTSEDIAMLLAYENGAELIVAVGSHSNMIDFLEKGRKGMASTFLVRLKIGTKLVDAKGVSKLYNEKLKMGYIFVMILAALVPIIVLITMSKPMRILLDFLHFKFKMLFGI